MRSLISHFSALAGLLILLLALPVHAQAGGDAALFEVADVAADVTADSSVHARDEAIADAQRSAFEQLLGRLGADSELASKLSDDNLATLVQNFEVQNERTSSVRYIGTFTVHFRPIATRDWLTQNGASFTETRSKPILILPVFLSKGHPVLWEERTKWWNAWEAAHNSGLVPIVLPAGGLDDIQLLSTEEAMSGNSDSLRALAQKYQATGGAAVVTFDGDLDNPGSAFRINVMRYDDSGAASEPVHINLPPASDAAAIDAALQQGVKQARHALEENWRQIVSKVTQVPAMKLPVVVPIDTLNEWNLIKTRLGNVPAVDRTDVVMLARGTTNIELEFHGGIEQLQDDLSRQNLTLTQDSSSGSWILQMTVPQSRL